MPENRGRSHCTAYASVTTPAIGCEGVPSCLNGRRQQRDAGYDRCDSPFSWTVFRGSRNKPPSLNVLYGKYSFVALVNIPGLLVNLIRYFSRLNSLNLSDVLSKVPIPELPGMPHFVKL